MYSEKTLLKKLTRPSNIINKYRFLMFVFILLESALSGIGNFYVPAITESFKAEKIAIGVLIIFVMLWQRLFFEIIEKHLLKNSEKLSIEVKKQAEKDTLNIANKVDGKVYNTAGGIERRLSPFEIKRNLEEYIFQSFSFRDEVVRNIINLVIFIATITGSIYTTLKMTNNSTAFICLLMVCGIVVIIVSLKQVKSRKKYSKKKRELTDKLREAENDFGNIYAQNRKHQNFLVGNYRKTSLETTIAKGNIEQEEANSYILRTCVMTVALSVMVVIALKDNSDLTYDVMINIVALTNMYEKIIFTIANQVRRLQKLAENYAEKDSHIEVVNMILSKYLEIVEIEHNTDIPVPIHKFLLKNFSYEYLDENGNIIHTVKADDLSFEEGTTSLIYGKSGYGKSTLVKAMTGVYVNKNRILVNDSIYFNYIYNYLMYMDDSSKIGSNFLLNEILTEETTDNLDEKRLVEILKGIRLYEAIEDKIKFSDKSVIDFLRENYKHKSSTGENKRYSLARTLYNLTEDVDILILDEPIGNIDEENAVKVIEFINEFANRDRKRIVIIISHQVSITRKFCSQVIQIVKSDGGNNKTFTFVKEEYK